MAVGSAGGQVVEWSTGFGPVTEQSMPTEFGVPRRSLSPRTLPGAEDWIYTLFYAGPSVVSVSRDGSLRAVEPGRLRGGGHAAFPGGEVAASARSPQAGSFATGGEDGVSAFGMLRGRRRARGGSLKQSSKVILDGSGLSPSLLKEAFWPPPEKTV